MPLANCSLYEEYTLLSKCLVSTAVRCTVVSEMGLFQGVTTVMLATWGNGPSNRAELAKGPKQDASTQDELESEDANAVTKVDVCRPQCTSTFP